ncbi:hypothetical protein NEHOM01_2065, partial [Nematocida homosporus]|uniref:uncharacterized protein n=1 Tax=Nematocida homosporus TaxID=1912981 RepID=UPI00221EFB1C
MCLSVNHIESNLKYILDPTISQWRTPNTRHNTTIDRTVGRSLLKLCPMKIILTPWVLGLCVLLVLLSNASGSSDIGISYTSSDDSSASISSDSSKDSGDSVGIDEDAIDRLNMAGKPNKADVPVKRTMLDLATTKSLLNSLSPIGLTINCRKKHVSVFFYMLSQADEPGLNSDSAPGTSKPIKLRPQYVIECTAASIEFAIPREPNSLEALSALNTLRMIAVIRVIYSSIVDVYVHYYRASLNSCQLGRQILSRFINIVDCKYLEFWFDEETDMEPDDIHMYLDVCRKEAQNAISQANYKFECKITCLSSGSSLSNMLSSGIVLLRPIAVIYLAVSDLQNTQLISRLSFKKNYKLGLYFNSIDVNLNLLQHMLVHCSHLIASGLETNLVGFENFVTSNPTTALEVTWLFLLYLGHYNIALVCVHTIVGIISYPHYIQPTFQSNQNQIPPEPRVITTEVILQISTNMPCRSSIYYTSLYTPAALAKHGIRTDTVQISYEEYRDDLEYTLNVLCDLNAIPMTVLDQVQQKNIICCGEHLSDSTWTLQETVNIELSHARLKKSLKRYITKICHSFCQNMRYSTIRITGTIGQAQSQIQHLIYLLLRFQNLTADTLTISNVQPDNHIISTFDLKTLKDSSTENPLFHLNVKTLILDNVDETIIYRIFSRYIFADQIEIHILNQYFQNLAIA